MHKYMRAGRHICVNMDNWASHLRHYRKETDNPKSRVSSRRGFDAYSVTDKGSDCGGYSLYSESTSENNIVTATKDLDRCARLLNDMLTNDQETTEMLLNDKKKQLANASNVRAVKTGTKKAQTKPKEKRLKGILTKKTTAKGSKKLVCQSARKQVKKALFSDTDSSMKSSVLAPPLNNSDAVKQATTTTCAPTNPGPVLTTSKPSTTRLPQRVLPNDRPVSPFTTGPNTVRQQQTNRPLFNTRRAPSYWFGYRIPSSTPTVSTPSKGAKQINQHELPQSNILTEVNPHELANRLTGLPAAGDDQYNAQYAPNRQPSLNQQQVENLNQCCCPQHELHSHGKPLAYPPQEYCTHQPQTWKQGAYPDERILLNSPPEKLKSTIVHPTVEQLSKINKPVRKTAKSKLKRTDKRTVDKSTEMTVIEEYSPDKNEVVANAILNNNEEFNEDDDQSDGETLKENSRNVYVETDPRLHHPRLSPVSRKARLHTLRYLFNELRSCTESSDGETERLINEIEDNLRMLVPSVNTMNTEYGIEVSLAMQPLRSENANLRRKLRLLEQQVRHRDLPSDEDSPPKPEQDFNVIHLQMLNHTLEKQLREERSSRELLQQQLKAVAIDVDKLSKEKSEMLQVLSNKDNNHIKSQHDWIEEAGCLRSELQSIEHEREEYRRKASGAAHEKEILIITLKEREKEVDRLQSLVSTFRSSMRKLVDDLSKSGPNSSSVGIMDQLNRTLQLGASPRKAWYPVDLTPTRESDVYERFPLVPDQPKSGLTTAALKSHNAKQETQSSEPFVTPQVKIQTEPMSVVPTYQPESGHPSLSGDNRSPKSDYGIDINETDYLRSPKIRAQQILNVEKPPSSRESAGFIDFGASTVKGMLGPFADRIKNLSPEKQQLSSLSSSEADDFSSVDEDVTLTEQDNQMRPEQFPTDSFTTENSRYSVTDYFDKYSSVRGNTGQQLSASLPNTNNYKQISSRSVSSQFLKSAPEKVTPVIDVAQNFVQKSDKTETPVTPQHQLYKGTELDTSLSTIRESDDVISVTSSAVTSSSVASIDDREFRHGLANLDANIARIQASLKHVLQK